MARIDRISLERKRELEEPDKFMVFVAKVMQFGQTYKKQITTALAVIVAAVVVIAGLRYTSARAEVKASDMLARVTAQKGAAETPGATDGSDGYKAVYEKYPRTVSGKLAGLRYADQVQRSGDIAAAIEVYKKVVKGLADKPTFHHLALTGLGYAYETSGDYKSAAECLEKIVAVPSSAQKETALFSLARIYDRMGEKEKSRKMFARIVSEYPDSMYADIAKEKSAS